MAFPGTYNISYYKGDTLEFNVYPKDSNGDTFLLTNFGNAKFTISSARGSAGVGDQIEAYIAIADDLTHVTCAIRPADGIQLTAGTTYVYDVEVTLPSNQEPYNRTYPTTHTLLTGNISVTDHVTGATA